MIERYFNLGSHRSFEATLLQGEVLFRKGVEALNFYLLISGKIIIIEPFSAKIIHQYDKGDMFGVPEVLMGENWKFMAEAKTTSSVQIFSRALLFDRIDSMEDKPKKLVSHLLGQR